MSIQSKIMNLIGGVPDPTTRIDIASTINYLFSLYCTGGANETAIREALHEVCVDVITATYPELSQDEIKERSSLLTDEFIKAFRLEGTVKRMLSRFGRGTSTPF
jgi:hypothetical protein